MKIKDFKKAILDNYQNSKDRKIGDYWSDEIEKGLDEILNYQDNTEIDDDIKTEIIDDKIELSELADSMVDVYTSELLKWYSDDIHRIGYADDFISEMGSADDLFKILVGGQYMYYSELLNYTFDLVKEKMKDLDLEAEEIMEGSDSLEEKTEKLEKI